MCNSNLAINNSRLATTVVPAVFFFGLVFSPSFGLAQEETTIFVHTIDIHESIQEDPVLLSNVVCGELTKQTGYAVVCENEFKQMADFAALRALTGGSDSGPSTLELALERVDYLVAARLLPGKFGYILWIEVSSRDKTKAGMTLHPSAVLGRYKIKGIQRDTKSLMTASKRLAPRIKSLIKKPTVKQSPPPTVLNE